MFYMKQLFIKRMLFLSMVILVSFDVLSQGVKYDVLKKPVPNIQDSTKNKEAEESEKLRKTLSRYVPNIHGHLNRTDNKKVGKTQEMETTQSLSFPGFFHSLDLLSDHPIACWYDVKYIHSKPKFIIQSAFDCGDPEYEIAYTSDEDYTKLLWKITDKSVTFFLRVKPSTKDGDEINDELFDFSDFKTNPKNISERCKKRWGEKINGEYVVSDYHKAWCLYSRTYVSSSSRNTRYYDTHVTQITYFKDTDEFVIGDTKYYCRVGDELLYEPKGTHPIIFKKGEIFKRKKDDRRDVFEVIYQDHLCTNGKFDY